MNENRLVAVIPMKDAGRLTTVFDSKAKHPYFIDDTLPAGSKSGALLLGGAALVLVLLLMKGKS